EALSSIQEVPAIEYPGQKSGQLKANTVPFMLKMIQQAQLEKNPPEKGLEGSRLDEDTEYYERLANLFPEKDDGKGEKNNLLDEIMPNLKFNRLFETAGNSDNDPSLLLKNATELNVLATEYNMKNWVKDPENSTELLRYINGLDSLLANNEDETSQETMKAMKIIREMRNDFTQIYEAIEG
ncbi:MAG: hypothetical protein NTZ80_03385, partial [Patescibacteria group bacterium]|nr:hypothetical protein [Patescibacteria group bacterium]